jgi:hypothetical protein|tara:strand:- start:3665 stop:3886 length:222 start_codon:yes stop_codon:yes gene_type:complete
MPSRIYKGHIVVQFKIKRNYNKETYNTVIYSVITLNKPKSFVPSHPYTLIPTRVTTVAANNKVFSYSSEAKYK